MGTHVGKILTGADVQAEVVDDGSSGVRWRLAGVRECTGASGSTVTQTVKGGIKALSNLNSDHHGNHVQHSDRNLHTLEKIERMNKAIAFHKATNSPDLLAVEQYTSLKEQFTRQLLQLLSHLDMKLKMAA